MKESDSLLLMFISNKFYIMPLDFKMTMNFI
jgi:hypothetical protein